MLLDGGASLAEGAADAAEKGDLPDVALSLRLAARKVSSTRHRLDSLAELAGEDARELFTPSLGVHLSSSSSYA